MSPRRAALVTVIGLGLVGASSAGCYLAHERPAAIDAGGLDAASDAPRIDAARPDAARPDAGAVACDALVVSAQVQLDEGVTPRLVALPGGEVGLVYVRSDGDPTRVIYERLDRRLARVTGPVTIATDSFTWAEIESSEGELVVAYGTPGSSVLAHVTLDGASTGERQSVDLAHPTLLQRTSTGALLWGTTNSSVDDALLLAHLSARGAMLHPTAMIGLGRYSSGNHVAPRADGSHVIGYPREGPRGVRHGYVRSFGADGTLGPERQLDPDDDDRVVIPVVLGDRLVLVRQTSELVLEPTDPLSLERLARITHPAREGTLVAGAIGDRLVIADVGSGLLRWALLSSDLGTRLEGSAPTPSPGVGSGTSVASYPDAIVIAVGLTDASASRPWVVRLECAAD